VPRGSGGQETRSYGYAELTDDEGRVHTAELSTGEGFAFTAAVAAETAVRVLDGAAPGGWTAGRLLGPELVAQLPGTAIELGR
jgi:saccharopine dehydrogenase (NAD+, L-lysine-forming)